jgi:hypothetical protein
MMHPNSSLHEARQETFALLRKGAGIQNDAMRRALKRLQIRIQNAPRQYKADGYWPAQYCQLKQAAELLHDLHELKHRAFRQHTSGNIAPNDNVWPRINDKIDFALFMGQFVFKQRPLPSGRFQADVVVFADKQAVLSAVGITALDRWALQFDANFPKRFVRGIIALARHPIKSFKV